MRVIVLCLLIFGSYDLFSQTKPRIKRVIELRANGDTVKIQEFDLNGNLVFWKHFPTDYGISQLLAYEYRNGKLTDYTWVHSNVGFVISEYADDAVSARRLTYRYQSKDKTEMTLKLPAIHSLEQLRKTKQYKKVHKKRNKLLSGISIYNDTLLMMEVGLNTHGDTTSIKTFDYKDGLLLKETRVEYSMLSILTYAYDTLGNNLRWTKVHPPADTSVQYIKEYNGKLLTREISISEGGKTVTCFYYNDGLLVREVRSNEKGKVEREITYTYNKDNTLLRRRDDYSLLRQLNEFTYLYETF